MAVFGLRVRNLAEEWKLIDRAPKVRMQKGKRRREFVLTGAQRDEFLGGLPEPCRTVARFLLDTGLRVGECCALTWDRVYLEGDSGYVFIARGKTERARRYIGLTADARAILERQKTLSRSQYVFVRFGERVDKTLLVCCSAFSSHPLGTVHEAETGNGATLGCGSSLDLAHALTDFGAAGADAFTIQPIAGHASVTTSQRYIHPLPETIQRAVARLEQYRRTDTAAQRPSLSVVPKLGVPATVSATVSTEQTVAVGK